MTEQISKIVKIFLIFMALHITHYTLHKSFAQDNDKLVSLSKKIIEAKTNEDLYAPFEELKEEYFRENKYNEFAEFLGSLGKQKKALEPFTNYYIALSRYQQLKYLEEAQKWDEYFALGNTYRDELTRQAQKAIEDSATSDPTNIYARLILWQFHKDQQDALAETALSDLMSSVLEYAKAAGDIKPLKEAADKLLSYGEKGKSKELYKIYAQRLVTSDIKDDALGLIASGFYKEGNLELSENIYNIYVERIIKSTAQEKLLPILIDIAREFSYKDDGPNDPLYAEKIFGKIEEVGGKKVFDQELMYLRAFNLEKVKEYAKAKEVYSDLVLRFPESNHAQEAIFKLGIINTYILREIKEGKSYFEGLAHSASLSANPERVKRVEGLARKETLSAHLISSLYHLGLLSQWEGDITKAKEYYDLLLEKAKESFSEITKQAQERLKEIQEAKPIEYNLKTFLDLALKEENIIFDMTKLDLRSHPYRAEKEEPVNISATAYTSPSGCMQIELQYLWSGDLGSKKPSANEAEFATTYTHSGTKVINLVVVSPTGIIDRSLDLVDVH